MKTERRHELQENTLVKEIETLGDKIRPHANLIGAVIAGAIGLFAVASWWKASKAASEADAWEAYQMAAVAGDREFKEMFRVAADEQHDGAGMQEWAYIAWADRQLRMASEFYLVRRDESKERLTSVSGIYEQLTGSSNPLIRNRAQFGLARVYELQNRFDEARAAYAKVQGALAELAAERGKEIDSKQVQDVYAWLANAEIPKPRTPGGPGTPGQVPNFEVETPVGDEKPTDLGSSKTLEEILSNFEK